MFALKSLDLKFFTGVVFLVNLLLVIFTVYTCVQGLGLLLVMLSSMVLCDNQGFADQPHEGTGFCDIGCCSLPTGMTDILFKRNQHEWKWEADNF